MSDSISTSDAQEAIWAASKAFGLRLEVTQQVAVARVVAATPLSQLTPEVVQAAFSALGLREPSASFAKEVIRTVVPGTAGRRPLLDVVLGFRRDAVRNLSRQYGGKPKPENELRDSLLMYLPQRGYAEAHTGKGQTDILLPEPDNAIIETKVWTTPQVFKDGLVELGEYIRTEQPRQAIYVVFGDRDPLPSLVTSHLDEIADERTIAGLVVPVVPVLFDVTPPSKVAQTERRKSRG